MSAKDDIKILHNILARGGNIEEIDLQTELSKAKSMINQFNARDQMSQFVQPPSAQMQPMAQNPQNNAISDPNASPMGDMPANGENGLNMP